MSECALFDPGLIFYAPLIQMIVSTRIQIPLQFPGHHHLVWYFMHQWFNEFLLHQPAKLSWSSVSPFHITISHQKHQHQHHHHQYHHHHHNNRLQNVHTLRHLELRHGRWRTHLGGQLVDGHHVGGQLVDEEELYERLSTGVLFVILMIKSDDQNDD